jgi:hypothetical protein
MSKMQQIYRKQENTNAMNAYAPKSAHAEQATRKMHSSNNELLSVNPETNPGSRPP